MTKELNATALEMGFTVLGCKNSKMEQECAGDVPAQLFTVPPEPPCSLCSAHGSSPRGAPCIAVSQGHPRDHQQQFNLVHRVLMCPDLPAYMWGQHLPRGNDHTWTSWTLASQSICNPDTFALQPGGLRQG